MKALARPAVRLFLVAWLLFSAHFATNVVREHYPAFSLVEHGSLFVDDYAGFHSDIFVHPNGHAVVGNQILVSVLAAVPLLVFDPVLDRIEAYSRKKLAERGPDTAAYRTDKPMRVAFFQLVKERGLDLRFGAATVVTSVFFMAPASALFLVFFYRVLRARGLDGKEASWMALLLGLATPIFFRTSTLNHNMFMMFAMFAGFVLVWRGAGATVPPSAGRRFWSGFAGGLTIAIDYAGVVLLPLLALYLLRERLRTAGLGTALRESVPFVAGAVPPLLFLLWSQWSMYGDPFLPGQYWMPQQNDYTELGMRGFTLPSPDLIVMNLFHPGYGLYTWAPILALALVPARLLGPGPLVLPRPERAFVAFFFVVLLLFSSANQYARLQWNSGFRYLLPLVPFLFLAAIDVLRRLPAPARAAIVAGAVLHSWVLTVFREQSIQRSWALFLEEGVQLPWFRVLRMTSAPDVALLSGALVPALLLAATCSVAWVIWRDRGRPTAAPAATTDLPTR